MIYDIIALHKKRPESLIEPELEYMAQFARNDEYKDHIDDKAENEALAIKLMNKYSRRIPWWQIN